MNISKFNPKFTNITLMALWPLIIFSFIIISFAISLKNNPQEIPSQMIDQPFPDFALPDLLDMDVTIDHSYFDGQVTLVNIFGSWCVACDQEHPMLMWLAENNEIKMLGVDWRDTVEKGRRWLELRGNPYSRVVFDADSMLAIDLGVTGAPESFIVDKNGQIRYKFIGPITPKTWQDELKPFVLALQAETGGAE
ncbi:MAG: DsbE family thiol:disulfide interchange protein [Robiginitomaculum sp.]|nr:MAG: DsbE family thiol:disulfide interchange protein [Robiginitomaculum sp.]